MGALLLAAGGEEPARHYDLLLAAHDYGALATQLKHGMETPDLIRPTLAWEQQRVAAGGSIFVSAMYALDLLAAGRTAAESRENAVIMALYTIAAIETDGAKCADPAPAGARRRQFARILAPVWGELRKLPDEGLARDLARALAQERTGADGRPPDDYLCRGRTTDIPDGLADAATEQTPHFAPREDWIPRQVAARSQLPAALAEFAARLKRGV
ncbi:MAG: hypothetical protein QOJ54_370 [Aliidongia sp.]|nr:hypothetical protein [Aliidongia sp.]